ncbi:hypothetical protein MA16_Dca021280 [Dendrobium catenatum]|uniref:Uncharacterized protein n=1 Tax=Dendrobium catenatum TaxID=906689 RepID=A0A2I0XHE5_9ASPA|nr:hypothetical protein MA16_Dca021280 [Dendrobium catenatum]
MARKLDNLLWIEARKLGMNRQLVAAWKLGNSECRQLLATRKLGNLEFLNNLWWLGNSECI